MEQHQGGKVLPPSENKTSFKLELPFYKTFFGMIEARGPFYFIELENLSKIVTQEFKNKIC